MGLFAPPAFRKFIATLPVATAHEQWESLVAKVGGKVFALCADSGDTLVFKVSDLAFEGLTGLDGIGQAAYFAKGQWVNVTKGADITEADLRAYIREAHRIISRNLTRKLQVELGLADL
jgi:predicted DNA-binding protein (MmcQ/YjbR family)